MLDLVEALGERMRHELPSVDRHVRAYLHYVNKSAGRHATIVTYAAFFLVFPLLVIFLIIVAWLLTRFPLMGRSLGRMLGIDPGTDVLVALNSAVDNSWSAAVGFVGVAGVVIAAAATASNLRVGLDAIFGRVSPSRSLLVAPALDFSAGIGLAAALLVSWLLALASVTRGKIVRGSQFDPGFNPFPIIVGIKILSLVGSVALIYGLARYAMRHPAHVSKRSERLAALGAAVFIVAANYAFLYYVMSIILGPDSGGGFAVAFVLLFWVSIVVRTGMYFACWAAVGEVPRDEPEDGAVDAP